ncbi:MAG: hypothetical protein QNJ16_15915 [Rhodobacter sp.]|nr:hypothetical protein [Rhodobacter sp.]
MPIHAAKLNSPRLQRVLALLADGQSYSTWEIVVGAQVMAVNTVIAELRQRGVVILCEQRADEIKRRRWFYTMLQ